MSLPALGLCAHDPLHMDWKHQHETTKQTLVTEVAPAGPAQKAGFQIGDNILEVNQRTWAAQLASPFVRPHGGPLLKTNTFLAKLGLQ